MNLLGWTRDNFIHVMFSSGGIGSWASAKRIIKSGVKVKKLHLLFTDTFIEDEDLYRFLIETSADIYKADVSDLIERCKDIPPMDKPEERKLFLLELGASTMERMPQIHWTHDGRDVWEVLNDKKFMSNSRIAHCSEYIKQKAAQKYVKKVFPDVENTILYLGIDWSEIHRMFAPSKNWFPYTALFPMVAEPLMVKEEMIEACEEIGIEQPKLYKLGFVHNNCGGFCVRAGQGHFIRLLETMPDRFAYHEKREIELMDRLEPKLGYRPTIMKKQTNGVVHSFSLTELREQYYQDSKQLDLFDIGGCGCFVNYNE